VGAYLCTNSSLVSPLNYQSTFRFKTNYQRLARDPRALMAFANLADNAGR
jgi:hypothetical protein